MKKNELSRRTFLRASSAAGLMAAAGPLALAKSRAATEATAATNDASAEGRVWRIPACAWSRPFGALPKIELAPEKPGDFIGLNTLTRTRKGIPLGGIGAGNFMYNLCGTFGPWQMKTGRYEERFLTQAAFHVREEVGGAVTARTLASEDVLPAWPRLKPGQGVYHALFPKGWCEYKGFTADVALQFFSPVIKENYRETSYPAAVFLFKLHNPGKSRAKVSVMFTFPNAPYTGPQNTPMGKPDSKESKKTFRERGGLSNRLVQDARNGVTAIAMEAHDAKNAPETEGTQWCIATNQAATYVPAWDGDGDGAGIWKAFAAEGRLENASLAERSAMPSGALCVTVNLEPGASATVPFALGWYFPQIEFGMGTRWWRRFTEWFPASGSDQAFHLCEEALANHERWLEAVDGWQAPILRSKAHPEWLKQAMLNELYYATFGGSFWENGCITKPKKFGNRPGQHISFVMECQEYPFAESFDVRHHPARSNRDLWPEQERATLLLFRDFVMDTVDGSCPHDAGSIEGDPLFLYDGYGRGYNQGPLGIKGRITTPWSELSPKFIQQCYAYYHKTRDEKFLDEVWPAMVRSYRYQVTTDTDGDGLSEMKSSEYLENKMFNAVLWLGALEMLEAAAQTRGEDAFLQEVRAMLDKARASTEREFWNAQYGYYQYNQHNDDMMGDGMLGQRYVDVAGMEPVLNPDRMTSHYRQLFRRGVMALKDCNGDGIGDMGVANAVHPDSLPGVGDSEYTHQFEVWTGVSYCAAANIYHCGKARDDGALQANAMLAAWGVYCQTWMNEETAYWFSTPEAWRINDPKTFRALMYQRARGLWEFAMEVHDPFAPKTPASKC